MISSAQKTIIKAVCTLQGDSVKRIYEKNRLTINEKSADPFKRSLAIMKKELGIEDMDVMAELSQICGEFDSLYSDVNLLETNRLSKHSINIFKFILNSMGYLWKDIYPNAYNKLVQRMEMLSKDTVANIDFRDTTMMN